MTMPLAAWPAGDAHVVSALLPYPVPLAPKFKPIEEVRMGKSNCCFLVVVVVYDPRVQSVEMCVMQPIPWNAFVGSFEMEGCFEAFASTHR